MGKLKRKYIVDMFLVVAFLLCMVTGYMLEFKGVISPYLTRGFVGVVKELHEWSAYMITALIIIHFWENFTWLKTMTKRYF